MTATLILALSLCLAAPLRAAELLVVQSVRDASFNEILKGFWSVCGNSRRVVVLSDYAEVDVTQIVREEQPALIVTVGDTALNSVRKIRRTPVLSLMSLGLSMGRRVPSNVTGVSMVAAPEQYLKLFAGMKARRVGVLYNPGRSGAYVNRAQHAAERFGVELIAQEVLTQKDIPQHLAALKGRVDALWLIPDTTAVTPANVESYFFFSLEQWKPVVAFSAVYLRMGAAAALEVDRFEMGRQGGEIAQRLLDGTPPSEVALQDPSAVVTKENQRLTQKLGITIHNRP